MVEVALLLKFTAKNPLVDPECFLEVHRSRVVGDDEEGDYLEFEPDSGSSDDGLPEEDEFAGLQESEGGGERGDGDTDRSLDENTTESNVLGIVAEDEWYPVHDDNDSSLSSLGEESEPDNTPAGTPAPWNTTSHQTGVPNYSPISTPDSTPLPLK